MEIDKTKISDVGIIALAIVEQQKHGQLCPVIIKMLEEIGKEQKIEKEFNFIERIRKLGVNYEDTPSQIGVDLVILEFKEFIKIIEMDLLKKYKRASIPIMEIIKKRAGS